MKKLLVGLLALSSVSAFSQVVDSRVGFSTSLGEDSEERAHDKGEGRILPVTVDVTRIISPSEFENKTDIELRASIAKGSFVDQIDNKEEGFRAFFGVGGEFLSLDRRRIFLKSGATSFTSLEFIKLEGIALFKMGDQVYLQINVHASLGEGLNSLKNGMFDLSDEDYYIREFLDQGQCLGCNTTSDWKDTNGFFRSGTNVEVRYKKLSINLFHQANYASSIQSYHNNFTTNHAEDVSSTSGYFKKHFKQQELGFTVTYYLSKDNSNRNFAIFAGLNSATVAKGASGKSNIDKQDYRFNERVYYRGNLNPTYDIDVHRTGIVTVGVRANINDLFKKKKK